MLSAPLSFYGGIAPQTGSIIDRSHADCGKTISGRILVLPGGRGSSSSSSVLAEAIRLGTGPAGIVLARPDAILVVGCIVADVLYGLRVPMMVCSIDGIADDDRMRMYCDEQGNAELVRLSC